MEQSFKLEIIEMLKPKIKSLLNQTSWQERDDLEQELILNVLSKLQAESFKNGPSFFDLIEKREQVP